LPYVLFAGGEQGFWYDPSDLSTLFQDAAGSTPVTAVEQPVRLMLDKSGRGNHATASADARRPVLSARVNQFERTEEFDNAAWAKTNVTVAANQAVAPNGTTTADRFAETTATDFHFAVQTIAFTSGASYTVSAYFKKGTGATAPNFVQLTFPGATFGTGQYANFNIDTGVVGTNTGGTAAITNVGNGWYRCSWTATATATASSGSGLVVFTNNNDAAGRVPSYAGATTSDVFVWGADVRVTNDGVGLPVYQRVTTSTDYDTTGFPLYLRFDGTDDCLLTGNIDFSATDKMTVCAGVRKFSDSPGNRTVAELSVASDSNAGAFFLRASGSGLTNWQWNVRATTNTTPAVLIAAPDTSVVALSANLGTPLTVTRRNGVQATSGDAPTGGGNFGAAYPLYIGARADASLRFNARLYQLIGRGALSDTATLELTEQYVNGKTRAY
jgi:hypothetical protein